MPVFTVHAPLARAGDRPQPDRMVFVRDGFQLSAALFGPLWFIAQRLWLGFLIDAVVLAALAAAVVLLRVDSDSAALVAVLVMLLTGFEAASVKRWAYSRGSWRLVDVVVAKDLDAAEHRFFARWNEARDAGSPVLPSDRGAPPPVRPSAGTTAGFGEVMGLFPQPRTPR